MPWRECQSRPDSCAMLCYLGAILVGRRMDLRAKTPLSIRGLGERRSTLEASRPNQAWQRRNTSILSRCQESGGTRWPDMRGRRAMPWSPADNEHNHGRRCSSHNRHLSIYLLGHACSHSSILAIVAGTPTPPVAVAPRRTPRACAASPRSPHQAISCLMIVPPKTKRNREVRLTVRHEG